jgi:uncharacterized protein Yka (UPF0111/DUF47 family)
LNAYELADALEESYVWTSYEGDAANMLRQQADRIAELEKQLQESAMNCISAYAQADEHYARVKELEKQRNRLEKLAEQMLRDGGDE